MGRGAGGGGLREAFLVTPLQPPRVLLFDWHGTLVNTFDAMYTAIDEMLADIKKLKLHKCLMDRRHSRNAEDAKLLEYVRRYKHLDPKVKAAKKVSRTDIFELLFGGDEAAAGIAHEAFNRAYRKHFGEITPLEEGVREVIQELRALGLKIGLPTNRNREFFEQELALVDSGGWGELFDTVVCGDDTRRRKPAPDTILRALENLGQTPGRECWYIGDSVTDTTAAREAGITSVFYNGGKWSDARLEQIFPGTDAYPHRPDTVVDDFHQLLRLVKACRAGTLGEVAMDRIRRGQIARYRHRMAHAEDGPQVLVPPRVILFDWHATLVDTLDAMYHAVDDVLPQLESLGLLNRLADASQSKSPEDTKLITYVREYQRLHPKIKADRKVSRTDIFEVLFGSDEKAKRIAHAAFNDCYRSHYGSVYPFEECVRDMLVDLRRRGLKVGVLTNRDREFFVHELSAVEHSTWMTLFDTTVCGDDTAQRKPAPAPILKALENLGHQPGLDAWYVGDSTTDTIAAKEAGVTSIFYNGAEWGDAWLDKIFPRTERYPHRPDAVVNDFATLLELVRRETSRACRRGPDG